MQSIDLTHHLLHQPVGDWQPTMVMNQEVGLTTSLDIFRAMANGEGPERLLVTLGYSGWAPDQIEYKLTENAWLTAQGMGRVKNSLAAARARLSDVLHGQD